MEISAVTVPQTPVLYFTTQTTIPQLSLYVAEVARKLYGEAARQNLLPVGPQQWIYYGLDGSPETIFTLEIALPVDKMPGDNSIFPFKELPSFKCVAAIHRGCWENLSETYQKLYESLHAQGLTANKISRELYLNIDFKNPKNAVTLVQVGVVS
jgi:effector-binding domain-containing protein